MNLNLFDLAASGQCVRVVIRKKSDGSFLLGVSDGKAKPLICQGTPEAIGAEFDLKLAGYHEEIRQAEIVAKLDNAAAVQQEPVKTDAVPLSLTSQAQTVDDNIAQDEFDFGF